MLTDEIKDLGVELANLGTDIDLLNRTIFDVIYQYQNKKSAAIFLDKLKLASNMEKKISERFADIRRIISDPQNPYHQKQKEEDKK